MEKYFALIKKHMVESIIVANDAFAKELLSKYDYVVDVTKQRPTVGDSYYPETDSFISNTTDFHHIPVDLEAEHLQKGTEDSFEPFKLSKYSVSYENGVVTIGCKQYSAPGLLDSLHKVLIEDHSTVAYFNTMGPNPGHGKFDITWEDAQALYDALIKVKF
jgi:hypothetical protein